METALEVALTLLVYILAGYLGLASFILVIAVILVTITAITAYKNR